MLGRESARLRFGAGQPDRGFRFQWRISMFFPRFILYARSGLPRWRFSERRTQGSGNAYPRLEVLEDRTLLSSWFPKGPAPILNGQTPGGRDAVSGRVTALAADPTDQDTIYL